MGDCWIYYCELCLPGKKWDKKCSVCHKLGTVAQNILIKLICRQAFIKLLFMKSLLILSRGRHIYNCNTRNLWKMEPICGVLHRPTMTEVVLGAEVKQILLISYIRGNLSTQVPGCTKWDSETCNNNHLSLIYYKLLLRKNHLLIWRHTFNCVACSGRTVTVTRLWRGFPLGVSTPGEKLPTGAAASICQSLSALRGTADLVAMFHLQLPLCPH